MPKRKSRSLAKTRKYILIAEDDMAYANIFQLKLTREGFKTQVAADGLAALKAVRQKKPDLILLDLLMPIKDGFCVLQELKLDKKLKDIKVIILTCLSQEEDIKKGLALGAIDYKVKSNVSIQEMVDKIKRCCP